MRLFRCWIWAVFQQIHALQKTGSIRYPRKKNARREGRAKQSRCHTTFQGGGPTVKADPGALSIHTAQSVYEKLCLVPL